MVGLLILLINIPGSDGANTLPEVGTSEVNTIKPRATGISFQRGTATTSLTIYKK